LSNRKIDIEKDKPKKLPSSGACLREAASAKAGEGDKNGDNSPSPQPSPIKEERELDRANICFWEQPFS
jgi:hypothetical protein